MRVSRQNWFHQVENDLGGVLTVRVHDREGVGTQFETSFQAGFLRTTIPSIEFVMNNVKPGPPRFKGLGDLSGIVGTFIIDDNGDALLPELLWNAQKHGGKRLFSAVRRNHDGFSHQAVSIKPFFTLWSKANIQSLNERIGFPKRFIAMPRGYARFALFSCQSPSHAARRGNRSLNGSR
jgi:hypothetical protein